MISSSLSKTLMKKLPRTGESTLVRLVLRAALSGAAWACCSIDPDGEVIRGAYRPNDDSPWQTREFALADLHFYFAPLYMDSCFSPKPMCDLLNERDVCYSIGRTSF